MNLSFWLFIIFTGFTGIIASPAHASVLCNLLTTQREAPKAIALYERVRHEVSPLNTYKNQVRENQESILGQPLHTLEGQITLDQIIKRMSTRRKSQFREWRLIMRANPWRAPEYPLIELLTAYRFLNPKMHTSEILIPASYLAEELNWMQHSIATHSTPLDRKSVYPEINQEYGATWENVHDALSALSTRSNITLAEWNHAISKFLIFNDLRLDYAELYKSNPSAEPFSSDLVWADSMRSEIDLLLGSMASHTHFGVRLFLHRSLGPRDWSSGAFPIANSDSLVSFDATYRASTNQMSEPGGQYPLFYSNHDFSHIRIMIAQRFGNPSRVARRFANLIDQEIEFLWFQNWTSVSIDALSRIDADTGHALEIEHFWYHHENPSRSVFRNHLEHLSLLELNTPKGMPDSLERDAQIDQFLLRNQIEFYQDPNSAPYRLLNSSQQLHVRTTVSTWLAMMQGLRY